MKLSSAEIMWRIGASRICVFCHFTRTRRVEAHLVCMSQTPNSQVFSKFSGDYVETTFKELIEDNSIPNDNS